MRRTLGSILTLGVLAAPLPAPAAPAVPGADPLLARAAARIQVAAPSLIELRRDLHRHPELSGQEARTAGVVAARLRKLGLEVRTGVGGHGVVAILRGARPGPRVAVRADMDAVREDAPDPVEFRSLTPGVRHACGHDVHTAVAIGVAEALAPLRAELTGSVVWLFQPAEERADGARAMLDDGALADGLPDAFFAFHTAPLEVGTIGTKPGTLLAPRDAFRMTLTAVPALSADPARSALIAAAADVTRAAGALSTLEPAARFRPAATDFRLLQWVNDRPGDVPRTWIVEGQLAASSDSLSSDAVGRLSTVAGRHGAKVVNALDYRRSAIPGAINDPALEARAREVVRTTLGDRALIVSRTVPPAFSEDFGAFQALAPGIMLWLGVSNSARGTVGMPHAPDYVADEGAIAVGARVMSALVLDRLRRGR